MDNGTRQNSSFSDDEFRGRLESLVGQPDSKSNVVTDLVERLTSQSPRELAGDERTALSVYVDRIVSTCASGHVQVDQALSSLHRVADALLANGEDVLKDIRRG